MKAAVNFLIQQGQSKDKAQEIFNALRNDIPSIRLPLYTNTNGKEKGTYKFAIGVERMYLDGDLSDGQTIMKLNKTLKLLAGAHANEYDSSLNGMSAQELNKRFETAAADELQTDVEDVNSEEYTSKDYTVVKIPDFETAEQYGQYTSWCVTHYENMYDSYTSDGLGLFYFFLKDGFENIEKARGNNCPLDEYGLSMIAVSINEDGSLNTVTCRWNHDEGGNDNIMNAKELSRVVGLNVYQVCKPYTRDELHAKGKVLFDEVQELLDKGANPKDIFTSVGNTNEGFAMVELNGKYNFINQEGRLISDQWFNYAYDFRDGLAKVEINGKWNFIDQEVQLISDQWFDSVFGFKDGFARVRLNNKYNFIDQEGRLISDQWFNYAYDFRDGLAKVEINGKWNFINQKRQTISDQWFNFAHDFDDGLAMVGINGKIKLINKKGQLVGDG